MIPRQLTEILEKRLSSYPAVALVGPRQSGKTTLAKSIPATYFDLELDPDRLRLDLQWNDCVLSRSLTILDEVQTFPEIFPRLRAAIDDSRKQNGRFLLLGSVSPVLMETVSESLAGRLSIIELTPLLLNELPEKSIDDVWLYGGFPDGGILDSHQFPLWQQDYLTLLVQRDLPNWGLPAKPAMTQRFLKMIAAVHGQLWNSSQIGQSLGITHPTVNGYIDFIEGTFLIRRLSSYQTNLRKRLIKSPRYYFRDSGLLHALLNVSNYNDLLEQPWVGASWEGFAIEQILGMFKDQSVAPYFFRTSDGFEINLVLDFGSRLWAIEIKLSSQPGINDMNRLNKSADLIKADKRILISRVSNSTIAGDQVSCSLTDFPDVLNDR